METKKKIRKRKDQTKLQSTSKKEDVEMRAELERENMIVPREK